MATRPARRLLHLCYCCDDAGPVVDLFVGTFGWRNFMSTPMERWDGTTLGLDGEAEAAAHFVYDPRGPRTSPAVEVQQWADPQLAGEPLADPTHAGIQACGIAVPDLEAATTLLLADGATVVGTGAPGPAAGVERWATVADARGTLFDLVEDPSLEPGETRFHHVRATSTDLDASVPWWESLGYDLLGRGPLTDGAFLGIDGGVDAEFARLRLPDEPTETILVQWREPAAHGRHPGEANHAGLFRMALGVDDTRAAYDAMQAEGIVFDRPPVEVELHDTPVPDMWICFLSDPDGVPVELVQRPRSAFR